MKNKILNKIHTLRHDLVEDCGISLDHVFLKLDETMKNDTFYTDIGERYITIFAKEEKDLFYGLLDLLQKVKTREILKIGLSESIAEERGVHIDSGRKHYTVRFYKDLIETMAYNKLNILQMHFSENLGYRLESKKYPEITSIEHLTQDDIKEIIEYAREFYVEVIPSFDTPGHLGHILKEKPEYQLENLETGLDITSVKARDFIKSMYDEIIEIFQDPSKIHIGADEFINFNEYDQYPSLDLYAKENISPNATSADTFVDYINEMGSYLLDQGKSVRVWSDGFYRLNTNNTVALDSRLVITYWTSWDVNMAPVNMFVEKGHQIINFNDANLYYVVGESAGYTYPTQDKIEANFEVYQFSERNQHVEGDKEQVLSSETKNLLGTFFSVWSDIPEAKHEDDILGDLKELLVSYGKKLWNFIPNL